MEAINQANKFANKSVYRLGKLLIIILLWQPWQRRNTRVRGVKSKVIVRALGTLMSVAGKSIGY